MRLSPERETVTVEGLGDDALGFAVEFQKLSPVALYAADMNYSFQVALRDFETVSELKRAIQA